MLKVVHRTCPLVVLLGCLASAAWSQDDSAPPVYLNPDITFTAQTTPLCPLERKLDGQWQASRVASDGKVYFGSSTHAHDTGAMFLQYDPGTGQVNVLAQDISYTLGEDPTVVRPQGKLHSDIVEHDGWLYTATYYGYTDKYYPGGHVIRYQLGSYEAGTAVIEDFGIPNLTEAIYTALTVDPVYGNVYVNSGDRLYRYDTAGTKTTLDYLGENCNYHFTDSVGNLWTTGRGGLAGNLYMVPPSGPMQTLGDALPLVRYSGPLLEGEEPWWVQNGRYFRWGDRIDADRFVFSMQYGDGLWEFDASKARDGDPSDAFRLLHDVGLNELDMALGGDTVYWLKSANPDNTHAAKAADHHLWSVSLDPNDTLVDWGRLVDQDGRTPYRCEGMSADAYGNVYLTGDWRVLENDPLEYCTSRHIGGTTYEDIWRGQFFAVATVPEPATLTLLAIGGLLLLRRHNSNSPYASAFRRRLG